MFFSTITNCSASVNYHFLLFSFCSRFTSTFFLSYFPNVCSSSLPKSSLPPWHPPSSSSFPLCPFLQPLPPSVSLRSSWSTSPYWVALLQQRDSSLYSVQLKSIVPFCFLMSVRPSLRAERKAVMMWTCSWQRWRSECTWINHKPQLPRPQTGLRLDVKE